MKIKLSLELVGDQFQYDYEIGGERQHGIMPFGADHLEWVAYVIKVSKNIKAYEKMMATIPTPVICNPEPKRKP